MPNLCWADLHGQSSQKSNRDLQRGISTPAVKQNLYRVANLSFRIFFSLGDYARCKNIYQQMTNLHDSVGINLSEFSMSDRVLFEFCSGKLHLYYHNFALAEQHLDNAFSWCGEQSTSLCAQKWKILRYLIVCRLVRGVMPTEKLLRKYNYLDQFYEISVAIKSGNLPKFNMELDKRSSFFLSFNCYSLMKTKLRLIVYRNFFLTMYLFLI
jgi:hypothetical protein